MHCTDETLFTKVRISLPFSVVLLTIGLGIDLSSIRVCNSVDVSGDPGVKLSKAVWYTTVHDLYRSNPFGVFVPPADEVVPESWYLTN